MYNSYEDRFLYEVSQSIPILNKSSLNILSIMEVYRFHTAVEFTNIVYAHEIQTADEIASEVINDRLNK